MGRYSKAIAAILGGLSTLLAGWGLELSPELVSVLTVAGSAAVTYFAPANRGSQLPTVEGLA